jgi:hypothetical protein
MDLAGAETPSYVDGRSLVPILTGSATTWRTAILIEGRKYSADPEITFERNYNAIRTSTNKYVEYEGSLEELYNLKSNDANRASDPYELANIYDTGGPTDPPLPDLVRRLDTLRGCQPDDPETPEKETPCQTAEDGP